MQSSQKMWCSAHGSTNFAATVQSVLMSVAHTEQWSRPHRSLCSRCMEEDQQGHGTLHVTLAGLTAWGKQLCLNVLLYSTISLDGACLQRRFPYQCHGLHQPHEPHTGREKTIQIHSGPFKSLADRSHFPPRTPASRCATSHHATDV